MKNTCTHYNVENIILVSYGCVSFHMLGISYKETY